MEFYLESAGTVVAVFAGTRRSDPWADGGAVMDGVGGVFERVNSPCASTSISVRYLREQCQRIEEEQARETHPALFDFLGE